MDPLIVLREGPLLSGEIKNLVTRRLLCDGGVTHSADNRGGFLFCGERCCFGAELRARQEFAPDRYFAEAG